MKTETQLELMNLNNYLVSLEHNININSKFNGLTLNEEIRRIKNEIILIKSILD